MTPEDTDLFAPENLQPNLNNTALLENIEVIHIIATFMTREQWFGFCLGNIIQYRLKADKDNDPSEALRKADEYQTLYEDLKSFCRA